MCHFPGSSKILHFSHTFIDKKQVCGSFIKPFSIPKPKLVGLIQTILHDTASQYNLTCYRQDLQIPNQFQILIARLPFNDSLFYFSYWTKCPALL
jgi:hypothetical protein